MARFSKPRHDIVAAMFHELRRMVANSVLFNLRMSNTLKMNPTDLQIINLLDIYGPLSPGRIARLSHLSTGGVTVALDRMEKADAIRREPNRQDRRSSLVRAKPKFLRSAGAAYKEMSEATAALLAQFNDKELGLVLRFLKAANDQRV